MRFEQLLRSTKSYVKESPLAAALFVAGIIFLVIGPLLVLAYNPITHPIQNPEVAFWWPLGIALYIAGVALLGAVFLDQRIMKLDSKATQAENKLEELCRSIANLPDLILSRMSPPGSVPAVSASLAPTISPAQVSVTTFLALVGFMDDVFSSIDSLLSLLKNQLNQNQDADRNTAFKVMSTVGAILIPVCIGLASIQAISSGIAVLAIVTFIIVGGTIAILLLSSASKMKKRYSVISARLTAIAIASGLVRSAFKSEVAATGSATNLMIQEFYQYFVILDAAIRLRILKVSSDLLDENIRKIFQAQVDYVADPATTFWGILNTPRGINLTKSSELVSEIIADFKCYSISLKK